MNSTEDLFQKAYHLHVVEERTSEARDICRQILDLDPNHHNARLLLGIILADYGTPEEVAESKRHFAEAIVRAKNIRDLFINKWKEEDPVYHLGLSEYNRNRTGTAALLFLIDYLYSEGQHSEELLFEALKEMEPEDYDTLQLLIKKLKEEYLIMPRKEETV